MDNNWQDKLRKDFEEYSEPAPNELWSAVEEGISEKWGMAGRRRKKRTIFFSSLSAAAAVAAVVVLFLVQKNINATDNAVAGIGTTIAESASDEDVPARPETPVATVPVITKNLIAQQHPTPVHSAQTTSSASAATEKDHSLSEGILSITKGNSDETVSDILLPEDPRTTDDNHFEEDFVHRNNAVAGRFSISLSASNITGNNSTSQGYSGLYGSEVANTVATPMSDHSPNFAAVLMSNNNQEIATKTKHFQPVKFGVSVAYEMTKRLSLEAGITYTFLISDLTSGTTDNCYETRQVLHYIGIPLNLGVNLWGNNHFDIYLSAGGMAEKCVYGTTQTTYRAFGYQEKGKTDRMTVKPIQWSLNAAAGVQYSFNHLVGLYFEPGVNYYFDSGSFVETIYTQKPWNFNLRLGLRFSF